MTGAAISVLDKAFGFETVCATDPVAARLDELQLDLGEGPCWDALSSRQPVLNPDIQGDTRGLWPILAEAIATIRSERCTRSRSLSALSTLAPSTSTRHSAELSRPTRSAMRRLWPPSRLGRCSVARSPPGDGLPRTRTRTVGTPRRVVHQATGMALVQLNVSAADALLIIRGHAYANSRSVLDTARDIVDRQLDFSG